MKKWNDKIHTRTMSILYTLTAIVSIAAALRNTVPLQIVTAILWTFIAILWWITYAKKRQEETKK